MARLSSLSSTLVLGLSLLSPLFAEESKTPARDVYVIPFSHLDLWWGGTEEECLSRGNRVISRAVQLAKADARFRFLIEANLFLANYADSHRGSSDLADLKRLVSNGQIEIAPKWTDIMLDLPEGEVIARDFALGRRYAHDQFGVDPQSASFADIPAFPTQLPQILALTRTPSAVISRVGPKTPLFDWKAPNGSRARFWYAPRGYDWGATLGLHDELNPLRRSVISAQVQLIAGMTDAPLLMHWGIDLYSPTPQVLTNLSLLNESFRSSYHYQMATPDDYFRAVANRTGVPELKGEIPSCWPNIVSSIPSLWPGVGPATAVLKSAEAFAAVNDAMGYADYPSAKLGFLWQRLIEACDHNQDGQGGLAGDRRKQEYVALVTLQGGEILRDSLRNIAERVSFPAKNSTAIVVFNPAIWSRTDLVHTHVTVYGDVAPARIEDFRRGVRLVDETGAAIPFKVDNYSENISRAYELTFVAPEVPSLGYRTFYLQPASEVAPVVKTAEVTLDRAKDAIDPRRAQGADLMENDYYRLSADKTTGSIDIFDKELQTFVVKNMAIAALEERGGNYVNAEPLSGRTLPETIDAIEMINNDSVSATLEIRGTVGEVPVTQRLTLFKTLKRIDVSDVVVWSKPRFFRLEQLIPYQITNAKLQYGVPFGSNDADNLVPGSGPHTATEIDRQTWLNSRMIHDWISAAGPDWQLCVATDHPYVRLDGGVLHAEMLRGIKYSSVRIVDQTGAGSMQYPEPGTYEFNYSLTSSRGDWVASKSYRFGDDFNNRLIAVSATDELGKKELPPSQSFLSTKSDTVVLSAFKKEDAGDGLVARFYEMEGRRGEVGLHLDGKSQRTDSLNLLEEPITDDPQSIAPFEIKTLRLMR